MINYGLYILLGMLIVAAIGIGVTRLLLCIVTVSGPSMAPTLRSRDRVLVLRRWPTKWLQKGQIVIGDLGQVLTAFEQMPLEARAKPLSTTSNFIKRVVGLPGDTVVIHISELLAQRGTYAQLFTMQAERYN
jgi:signal peptidase I